MEINTTSQISANLSKLQLNTQKRAFESDNKVNQKQESEIIEETPSISSTQPIKPSIDVEDIQKYANYMGENLSIDDINYGLRYGRSVIADYLA